jgi:hypothetical protein
MAPGGVLLLDKNWDRAEADSGGVGILSGEEKELIFLQAYAHVANGTACWFDQWRGVTWGCGPPGTDDRFQDGRLQGPRAFKARKRESVVKKA